MSYSFFIWFLRQKSIGFGGLNIFSHLILDIRAQELSRLGGSMRFSYLIITDLSLGFLLQKALFFY
jgi:hypothetical protein